MAPILTKKPLPFPEIPLEPIQASAIVVIHPGSMYLRIGRASDAFPHTIPHVIARRSKSVYNTHEDPFLMPAIKMEPETAASLKEVELTVSSVLASCLTSHGKMRYPTQPDKAAEYNLHAKPEILPMGSDGLCWTRVSTSQDYVIGEEVLYLNLEEKFHIHWPIRRGQLNIHGGIGGSLWAVLANLETIWATAMQQVLDIPLKDLKHYRAVLVIPDVYNRLHVKEMVNLLLIKLGFGGCFIHLESVCASFGAGLSYACVVDVGDQKTSVSCVEDGVSHRSTRLSMEYGGSDATQLFHYLLRKGGFPYQKCNPSNRIDAMLLQSLKENLCHVNLDVCGIQEKSFQVKYPERHIEQYYIKVGDECIIAPLGLFHPELFGLTGPKKIHTLQRYMGDPDDPYDENFLIQTQRKGAREAIEGNQSAELGSQGDDGQLVQGFVDEDMDANDSSQPIGPREVEKDLHVDQLLGIDQAILQSIEQCDSDDLKRKMYGCILLVGGGILFPGIHTWLQNRLSVQIPIMFRGEPIDIVTRPKDMDPRITTWKGAAVMSCLDTAQELWIHKKEWQRSGVKVLRERAPFFW